MTDAIYIFKLIFNLKLLCTQVLKLKPFFLDEICFALGQNSIALIKHFIFDSELQLVCTNYLL